MGRPAAAGGPLLDRLHAVSAGIPPAATLNVRRAFAPYTAFFGKFRMIRHSAICTALSAAPLRNVAGRLKLVL